MSKYEDMSDFEINGMVGKIIFELEDKSFRTTNPMNNVVEFITGFGDEREFKYFNGCNNPSDAWPIIVESNISMLADSDYTLDRHLHKFKLNFTGRYVASAFPVMSDGFNCDEVQVVDKNPLRAAMICFLKMRDAEVK